MKPTPFLVTLLVSSSAFAAPAINPAKLPLRADAPILFVPNDWKIEKTVEGDLNKDKIPDSAIVLVEANKTGEQNRKRALLILLREGKGFKRAGFSSRVLLGTRDGGAFWGTVETPFNLEIARGVLNITLETGSRNVLETTQRFRFDARQNRFLLIGFDSLDRDRATGEVIRTSANYLTGRALTQTIRLNGTNVTTRKNVSRKLKPLENVSADDRFQFSN